MRSGSSASTSTSPIDQLVDQIKVVAERVEARTGRSVGPETQLQRPQQGPGPNPNIDARPRWDGIRDPLIVYYDAQVNTFVK